MTPVHGETYNTFVRARQPQGIPIHTKLTLRLDKSLVKLAKAHAKRTKKSVSQMVADYFALLGAKRDGGKPDLAPRVRSLVDALRGAKVSEDDYRRYLEEKYL